MTTLQNGNLGERSLDTRLNVLAIVGGSNEVSTTDSVGVSHEQVGVEAKD